MNKLEKWLEKNKPQKTTSKLGKALDDILVLKEQGYTLEQVQAYLSDELKINTSISNLSSFLKRHTSEVSKVKTSEVSKKASDDELEKAKRNEALSKAFAKFAK